MSSHAATRNRTRVRALAATGRYATAAEIAREIGVTVCSAQHYLAGVDWPKRDTGAWRTRSHKVCRACGETMRPRADEDRNKWAQRLTHGTACAAKLAGTYAGAGRPRKADEREVDIAPAHVLRARARLSDWELEHLCTPEARVSAMQARAGL